MSEAASDTGAESLQHPAQIRLGTFRRDARRHRVLSKKLQCCDRTCQRVLLRVARSCVLTPSRDEAVQKMLVSLLERDGVEAIKCQADLECTSALGRFTQT